MLLLGACGQRSGLHGGAAPAAGSNLAVGADSFSSQGRSFPASTVRLFQGAPPPPVTNGASATKAAAGSVVKKVVSPPTATAGGTLAGPVGPNPLALCPVQGPVSGSDGFGAPRYAGGYHPHAGIDIMAPEGAPIVAPFPGMAVATPNLLGGNAVTVYGAQGYVYNAHLSRYGRLGPVGTGTVVGYVGNTGDAQGGATHDHFEWHPKVDPANLWRSSYGYTTIGTAIDPFPYLKAIC